MAMKTLKLTNLKLKVGSSVEGFLLSKSLQEIDGDKGKFDLCKLVLNVDKIGPTIIWVQGDYFHVLELGLKTRITKVETSVDGEKGTRTNIEQDGDERITV